MPSTFYSLLKTAFESYPELTFIAILFICMGYFIIKKPRVSYKELMTLDNDRLRERVSVLEATIEKKNKEYDDFQKALAEIRNESGKLKNITDTIIRLLKSDVGDKCDECRLMTLLKPYITQLENKK